MANDVVTNTFVSGNLIKSSEANTNFDDVTNNMGIPIGVASAQNYFELLKQSDVDNEDYLIADIFTDSDGVKNTISTGDSSARYNADDDLYTIEKASSSATGTTTSDSNSLTQSGTVANFFDDDENTYWGLTDSGDAGVNNTYAGKTFTSTLITNIYVKAYFDSNQNGELTGNMYLQTYDGATWTNHTLLGSGTITTTPISFDDIIQINDTIQGYRVRISTDGLDSGTSHLHRYYEIGVVTFNSTDDVETNTLITLDGNEKGIIVFDKSTKPTNTSITVDVSDGTTTLAAQSVRSYIDISSLSSGNLSLDFNLNTTDTSATPSLYGYGLVIIK